MNQNTLEKGILSMNIFSLIYFLVLAVISYYPIQITLFEVVAQIITIPLILFLLFSIGYCTIRFLKKERRANLISSFMLSLISILFLVILTIIQMA